ncbi:MAG: SRPBCC family protein [Saprospiraceae bacterium]|nr:SRPBCC family protein [Saprospiraceae bacterium]MBK7810456.1 SRPBCC family protein [Saprospiraceae bacterium]MBK9043144.1 SRPBCC family protein [Saprospiraceae bacterium]MBK9630048.1 SRPBCC family protein [Saprospiraceae bacterium]
MYYHFITEWKFEAPVELVWEEIYHSENWPSWWRGVLSAQTIETGNETGIGDRKKFVWQSLLPYKLSFESVLVENIKYRKLAGNAFGELEGTGIWTFEEKNGMTYLRYDWKVKTTKKWMNVIAPIAKPFFKWNHDVIMEWGHKALAQRLMVQQALEFK